MNAANFSNTPVEEAGSGEKKVWQYERDAYIDKYPEIDFLGYMKTKGKEEAIKRKKVLRVSPLISLEPYMFDIDYQINMSLANRGHGYGNIAQTEMQYSFFTYNVCVDLDRLGIDENSNTIISNQEKIERMEELLDAIKYLYADIKGRRENLSPVFIIGGIYERKNPFFSNRIKFANGMELNVKLLKQTIEDAEIQEDTLVGYVDTALPNNEEILKEFNPLTIGKFFNEIKNRVRNVYSE
jgi:CRISPR-associated protein Cst2